MIGLVRELTRASLFAAFWKPVDRRRLAAARMKFSSVKALTMRMPCAVSCSDSIICIAPWNSLAMILRTRMPILRTPTAASGHEHQRQKTESNGSCDTMTMTSPTIVRASRESVVMSRLRTLLADWAMKAWRAMNSDECDWP